MKKRSVFLIMLFCLMVLILAFVSCDEKLDENDGKSLEFSLDKVDDTSFTVTVSGAQWASISFNQLGTLWNLVNYDCRVTETNGNTLRLTNNSPTAWIFNTVITSPTVRTFTLTSNYTSIISGTISLNSINYNQFTTLTNYRGDWKDSFKPNPNKSSITW